MRTPIDCSYCGKYFMYNMDGDIHLHREYVGDPLPTDDPEFEKESGLEPMNSYIVICPECHEKEVKERGGILIEEPRRSICISLTDLIMTDEERIFWKDEIEFMISAKSST